MLKTGGPTYFLEEPRRCRRLGQLGTQDLDRDGDAALRIASKMHRRRRALTEEALDGIASGEEAWRQAGLSWHGPPNGWESARTYGGHLCFARSVGTRVRPPIFATC